MDLGFLEGGGGVYMYKDVGVGFADFIYFS